MTALGVSQSAHIAENSLLGVLTDGAGIEDDHIGALFRIGHMVAAVRKHTADTLGIGFILLTAIGIHKGQRRDALFLPVGFDLSADVLLRLQLRFGNNGSLAFHDSRFLQNNDSIV